MWSLRSRSQSPNTVSPREVGRQGSERQRGSAETQGAMESTGASRQVVITEDWRGSKRVGRDRPGGIDLEGQVAASLHAARYRQHASRWGRSGQGREIEGETRRQEGGACVRE